MLSKMSFTKLEWFRAGAGADHLCRNHQKHRRLQLLCKILTDIFVNAREKRKKKIRR